MLILCVCVTWCSRRHRGSRPRCTMTASSRDLMDVLALQRCYQCRFSNMVGVSQTQLHNTVISQHLRISVYNSSRSILKINQT